MIRLVLIPQRNSGHTQADLYCPWVFDVTFMHNPEHYKTRHLGFHKSVALPCQP